MEFVADRESWGRKELFLGAPKKSGLLGPRLLPFFFSCRGAHQSFSREKLFGKVYLYEKFPGTAESGSSFFFRVQFQAGGDKRGLLAERIWSPATPIDEEV